MKLINKVKLAFKKLVNYIPSYLPVGMTEFTEWSDSIVHTYNLPDNDSIRFAIAVMIMHFDALSAKKSKHEIMLRVKKGMANQVAAEVTQQLKRKQEAEIKAQQEAAEATAVTQTDVPDGPAQV